MNFNPDTFANSVIEGEMDTKRTPVPIGEYTAIIEDFKPRTAKDSALLDITYMIDDAGVKQALGRDKVTCRQSIFLDIDESGGLDRGPGKNIQLGKLREAVGQNGPSAWSPSMLVGQTLKVKVTHRSNPETGDIYDQITGTSRL